MLDVTLEEFLDRLGSKEPTPGGGSVAALVGALAAALAAMVCHLTIGKKKYAEHEPTLREALARADAQRADLAHLVDADIEAYEQLSAAYRLPRDTPAEQAAREAAIQEALAPATEVPLGIAEAAAQVLDLSRTVAEKGSVVAVSDAGMAALLAAAALRSGALNVLINVAATADPQRVAAIRARLAEALGDRVALAESVYAQVVERIEGDVS